MNGGTVARVGMRRHCVGLLAGKVLTPSNQVSVTGGNGPDVGEIPFLVGGLAASGKPTCIYLTDSYRDR